MLFKLLIYVVLKSVVPTFITRFKKFKELCCIIKTFDLVFKFVGTDFGIRSKDHNGKLGF